MTNQNKFARRVDRLRRVRIRITVLVSLAVLAGACSTNPNDTAVTVAGTPVPATALVNTNEPCVTVKGALTSQSSGDVQAAMGPIVQELSEPARAFQKSGAVQGKVPDDVVVELFGWMQKTCYKNAAVAGSSPENRRLGLTDSSLPAGSKICYSWNGNMLGLGGGSSRTDSGMVIFGNTSAPDPYLDPMLGIAWTKSRKGFAGDGTKTAVTVRGVAGTQSAISVFQQTMPDGLGTVLSWSEAGYQIGLFDRRLGGKARDDLLQIAESLQIDGSSVRLPPSNIPVPFSKIYEGTVPEGFIMAPTDATYVQTLIAPGSPLPAQISVSGRVETPEAFEAFRFFAVSTTRTTLKGNQAIVGNFVAKDAGPSIVTWRDPDGVVARVVTVGASPSDSSAQTAAVADRVRELNQEQWRDLVGRPPPVCGN